MNRIARIVRQWLPLAVLGGTLLLGTTGASGSGPVTEAWVARHHGSGAGFDEAQAVVVDADGNVIVTGRSHGGATGEDYATIKYDGVTGAPLWTAHYDGPVSSKDRANAVAVDANGDIFVTGGSYGAIGRDDAEFDFATVKYDGDTGAPLWVARYNGPGFHVDEARAIAIDASGDVVITGYSYGGDATWSDFATIKYSGATGDQLWVSRYNGPATGDDLPRAVALDPFGDVVVTGETWTGRSLMAPPDFATVKVDGATGAHLWTSLYNGPGAGQDQARDIAVDGNGDVVITGASAGTTQNDDTATIKYAGGLGTELWVARYTGPGGIGAEALALDSSGNVVIGGTFRASATNLDFGTLKLDGTSGVTLWAARYDGPAADFDAIRDVTVDGAGNVIVTGYSTGDANDTYDIATIKYAGPTGACLWTVRYSAPTTGNDGGNAVVVDAAGDVVVTGKSYRSDTNYDYVTIKYSEPRPAADVTGSCQVTRGGLRKNLRTGRYAQVVTVKNTSAAILPGPVSLVLDQLSANASLFNRTGLTSATSPTGSPYRDSAASLSPGASVSYTLDYTNPANAPITWTPRILAGSGGR